MPGLHCIVFSAFRERKALVLQPQVYATNQIVLVENVSARQFASRFHLLPADSTVVTVVLQLVGRCHRKPEHTNDYCTALIRPVSYTQSPSPRDS